MLTSLDITNFRGLTRLSMPAAAPINLITGGNDAGKTSLLEAVFLLESDANIGLTTRINLFRGLMNVEGPPDRVRSFAWQNLFGGFDMSVPVVVHAETAGGTTRTMTLMTERTGEESPDYRQRPGSLATASAEGRGSIALTMKVTEGETVAAYSMAVLGQDQMRVEHLVKPEDERAVSYFLPSNAMAVRDEDVALFGDLSMGKAAGRIVEALQTMDARIANVTTIQGPAGPMLFADVGLPKLLPLPFLGEGVHRFLAILLRVAAARGGVVLIDGIEHSIHHSAMPALWAAVRDLASGHGTQVFATTQSWECVVAASEAFAEAPPEQFLLHRIERRGDQLVAVTYEPDVLGAAVEHGFEVR